MLTILIIDDCESDHFYNEVMLKKNMDNINILKAYDGAEALELLEEHGTMPDLVLLDINMPRMNGLEFLEHFSIGNTRHIPVVVMLTSSDQHSDKQQSMSYACVRDYLLKPIDPHAIKKIATHAHILGNASLIS